MPALREYSIFISHAWDYSDEYYAIVKMLDEASNFDWSNFSVPEENPIHNLDELEYELRNRMRPANVFIALAGMYAARREWIEFEIDFARRIGLPIIGVLPWGAQQAPRIVMDAASKVVGWNSPALINAIRDHARM